jgi:hypothetical protein
VSDPATAREALIVEALGEVALLLDRVESLTSSIEVGRLGLANASANLDSRLKTFEAGAATVAQQVQVKAIEHIIRRTGKATSDSIELQARAMSAAARLAFSTEVDSNLAHLTHSLQRVLHRVDRPWDVWLTHAATAGVSAALTWWVVSSSGFR